MDMAEHRKHRKRNRIENYTTGFRTPPRKFGREEMNKSGLGTQPGSKASAPKLSDPEHLYLGHDVEDQGKIPGSGTFERRDIVVGHEGGTRMPDSKPQVKPTYAKAGHEPAGAKMPGLPGKAPYNPSAKALDSYEGEGRGGIGMEGPTRMIHRGHNAKESVGGGMHGTPQGESPHVAPPSQPGQKRKRSMGYRSEAFAGRHTPTSMVGGRVGGARKQKAYASGEASPA